jgi:hypothetical protein
MEANSDTFLKSSILGDSGAIAGYFVPCVVLTFEHLIDIHLRLRWEET